MAYPDDEDVGSAITGQRPPGTGPLQNIMTPQPGGFLSNPADQAALLSIGLQLMQPLAGGQTVAGHIGEAIGAGGESATASEAADLKRRKLEDAAAIAEQRTQIAQQRADDAEKRGLRGGIGGISAALGYRMTRDEQRDAREDARRAQEASDKELDSRATGLEKKLGNVLVKPDDPDVLEYGKGATAWDIKQRIKAKQAPAAASPTTPTQTATDPKTGRKIHVQNGQWVDETGKPVQ